MVRIRCVVEVGLMATDAGAGQRAVIAGGRGVALRALHGHVEASERERRVVVIERRCRPVSRAVALRAICRETGGDVVGIRGASEVLLMAAVASRRQTAGVVIVGVAKGASHRGMGASQWERRVVVIER